MSQEEKDRLLEKDVTELTPEDIEELNQIINEGGIEEVENILIDSAVYSAVWEYIHFLHEEGVMDGLKAFIRAFNEYSKEHKGKVRDFFTDPALPEMLQQIYDIAAAELVSIATKCGIEIAPAQDEEKPIENRIISKIPNAAAVMFLNRIINSGKNGISSSKINRHEVITVKKEGANTTYTRENQRKGNYSEYIIQVEDAETVLKKTGKTFTKCLLYALEQMNNQNFPREVYLPLNELVDRGAYSTVHDAKRAMINFFETQKKITIGGTEKRGKKTTYEEGGVLFYHYKYKSGGALTFSVNDNFNWDLIKAYFTIMPRFAYALSSTALLIVWYIFYLARQNIKAIKEGGTFKVSLESVRSFIGLPDPAELKNRKYKQYIITPIEDAIEEIENAVHEQPQPHNYTFTITPYIKENANITEWLNGYLEIGLAGDFAESFIQLADSAEEKQKQWQKEKTRAAAKLQAIEERKNGG